MSEKFLSEADWKKFSRSGDYKDAALLKALAALDKAERGAPADRLKALDEVEKQADALLKAHKGDKGLADYVDDLEKAAKRQRKLSETAAREAAAEQDEEEGEEASPVLLTTKMLPLLRELRKGEARMHALIALAGRDTAVLIMRRAISPARRKLLAEYLQVAGGVKYIAGECLLEEKALTFVVQSQAAGLAKRLKAALLAQTELRLKVRVRGDDGAVEDDGEEDGASAGDETEASESTAAAAPAAGAPTTAATAADAAQAARYQQRLQALMPALQRAVTERSGDVGKMRAVAEFASEKAAAGNPAAALQALDALEKLLAAAAPAAPPANAPENVPLVVLQQSRLLWDKARKVANAELDALKKAIVDAARDDPQAAELAAEIAETVAMFDELKARFDDSLLDKLDQALNASDPHERSVLNREAVTIIRRHQATLADDRLIGHLEGNPFLAVNVEKTLGSVLDMLAVKLSA